ncbi:MAG: DUF4239 domain-containing protein [Acidobacteriaceae bacterium]|nr:DUF4239 domain-containing protein [Acidobacteriaceae bacterium]
MLNNYQSIAIVIAIIAGSIGFLGLLHRVWPSEQRRLHNELIGWQIAVLGTTYAVIVGFMLYAVWTEFQMADSNAAAEANSLLSVVRASQGLPVDTQREIQNLAEKYADLMVNEEWPAMSDCKVSPASHTAIVQLWRVALGARIHDATAQTSLDHTLTELSSLSEYRRRRHLQINSALPSILWAVLVAGAIVTIVSSCMFGSADFRLHFIQVFMLALLIGLALVAIADINRPFQGSVHVDPSGFEQAREILPGIRPVTH